MTFLQMQDEALNYCADPTTYRDRIKRWLNEGQQRVLARTTLSDSLEESTVTAVAGASLLLTIGGNRIDSISIPAQEVRLRAIEARDLDNMTEAQGCPVAYYIVAGTTGPQVHLYPTPDAAYEVTVRFWQAAADMVNDSDVSLVPGGYHDMLVNYAVARIYLAEDDAEMFQMHDQQFEDKLRKLAVDRQYARRDGPIVTPGTWGDPHTGDGWF